ncbi:hypothetical protein [Acinetobacter sp. YH01026]|uniref:hypothetical protein n=1 Tax=Acinetobacter sp. YH01026 TaxID=2601039 RepID=UPI0015D12DDD|nr:hypothetical protein [Acinetobacter sp. YH01026]
MAKINPWALGLIGGVTIFAITYILFWVFYFHTGTPEATSATLNTLGSYFGGIATLWAAFLAAYLYSDWRKPHKANFYAEYCKKIFESYFQIISLQQKLKVAESKIAEIIINKDTNKKTNPNFLPTHSREELKKLNFEIDNLVNDIYLELDFIYKNTNTLAFLTENTSILISDTCIRNHLYKLYRPIREHNPPNQPYYKYNHLLSINKDNFLIIKRAEFLNEIRDVGGLK